MLGDKRFLFPGISKTEDDSGPEAHGTCMVSKVAGPLFGTAKKANVVMVKLSPQDHTSAILNALLEIENDVQLNNLRGKAVVSMSLSCKYINQSTLILFNIDPRFV